MVLDPAANFVRGEVNASVASGDTTVSVTDASLFLDPSTEGEYNAVIWDAPSHPDPYQDPDREIVRVTAIDTTNDDLTVTRGQESTSDTSHPSGSAIQMSPTAKMFSDIDSDKLDSANYTPEQDTHSRYADSEARSAIEAGDLSSIDGVNSHRIRFDSDSSYVEITDHSNSRNDLVTEDTYINETGTWLADHIGNNSPHHSKTSSASELSDVSADSASGAHHSRYSDSEVRSAIEAGNVDHVQFSNTEDIGLGQIGRDNSIGFLGQWGSNNTAVLWDAYNVIDGHGISISGGQGNESNPKISVDESNLNLNSGTLTDETSNRSSGTTYQNTTGDLMIVWIKAGESELSVGSTTSLSTAGFDYIGSQKVTIGYVPDNDYYELDYGSVDEWYETTMQ